MSNDSVTLGDFIQLGEAFFHFYNPQVAHIDRYQNDVVRFLQLLRKCGLERTRTAAGTLEGGEIKYLIANRMVAPVDHARLRTLADSLSRTLYEEANSKQLIITDDHAVSAGLLNLPTHLGKTALEPHQEALREDVITCLKARAYRPAIVVAWALGFDLVRTWIFADAARLADFNTFLQQRTQRRGVRQIVNYHDFFNENESFILKICRDATGALLTFTSKTYRLLENLLDDRNAFAHANYNNATEAEAKAYIDRMIRILSDAPFR